MRCSVIWYVVWCPLGRVIEASLCLSGCSPSLTSNAHLDAIISARMREAQCCSAVRGIVQDPYVRVCEDWVDRIVRYIYGLCGCPLLRGSNVNRAKRGNASRNWHRYLAKSRLCTWRWCKHGFRYIFLSLSLSLSLSHSLYWLLVILSLTLNAYLYLNFNYFNFSLYRLCMLICVYPVYHHTVHICLTCQSRVVLLKYVNSSILNRS